MAERKRRGLGRGLGALINSDVDEDQPATGAAAQVVPPVEPEIPAEPVSRETSDQSAPPERPIDVFFSAKSHLATQRVTRDTPQRSAESRPSTTPRRGSGAKRAEMPDVLGSRGAKSTAGGRQHATERREAERREAAIPNEEQNATSENSSAVSRETRSPADAEFLELPVTSIRPNPRQPRDVFDEEDMAELIHSVREIGVLQPIVVRRAGENSYELIMGERRWRASQEAGRDTIPAVVRHTNDEDLLRDALLENIHRSQLNPLEEAAAYQQLLEDFSISQEELGKRIGRSRPQISNTLRLMRLPASVQRRVAAGVLSSGHARAVLSLETEEQMETLAARIVAEGLSVRGAEEAAGMMKRDTGPVSRETPRLPSPRLQQLDEYAEALTDRLDTQVKISLGAKKGRIAIDFASIDDLNRIMDVLSSSK